MIRINALQATKKPLFRDFQIVCMQTKREQKIDSMDVRDKLINSYSGGEGGENVLTSRGSERRGHPCKILFRNGETRKKRGANDQV